MPTLVTRRMKRPELPRSLKILIAVALAVIIHVLFLLLLVFALPYWPRAHRPGKSAPITLVITKSTPGPDQALVGEANHTQQAPYIRTPDSRASDEAPEQPAFQSDKNTKAASDLPATGDKPLPTQQGKEIPAFDFDTQPFRLDKVAADAATAAPASPTDARTPSKDQQRHPKTSNPKPDSTAKPSAQPQATPVTAGELASLKAQPSPTPQPTPDEFPSLSETPPPPEAQPMARQNVSSPATPSNVTSPGPTKRPGYQPQTIQTKMAGSISNRGRSSVAALGTPFGRYNKAVSDQVGMRWYYYIEQRADLISIGSVRIHFVVSEDGHVHDVRVVSGNPSSALATISLNAVTEAELPPMPADVAATLDGRELPTEFDFSMY